MKRRLSLRGRMFVKMVSPLYAIAEMVTFLTILFLVIKSDFNVIESVLYVIGGSVLVSVLLLLLLFMVVYMLEIKWEKDEKKFRKQEL